MLETKFIKYPFAVEGDKIAIPNPTQGGGGVSWQQGYGPDYAKNSGSDPTAKDVPRKQFNQALFDLSTVAKQFQIWGVPNFITPADNDATPWQYGIGAKVLYQVDEVSPLLIYQSLVDANVALPTDPTAWRLADNNTEEAVIFSNAVFESGVVDGDAVYWKNSSSKYDLALADGTGKQNVIGLADVTNSRVYRLGIMAATGLTANTVYYLDPTTPGALTTTSPSQNIVIVGQSLSATTFLVDPQPATFSGVAAANGGTISLTVAASATAVIPLTVASVDPYSMINTTTYRIKPVRAGYYMASAQARFEDASGGLYDLKIRKNGTDVIRATQQESDAVSDTVCINPYPIFCDGVNDYLDLAVRNGGAADITVFGVGSDICMTVYKLP